MEHQIEKLDDKGLRKFGLVTGLIVVILFGGILPWIFDHGWPYWPWIIAAALWIPALLIPRILDPVYRAWMRFGLALGWLNSRIILGFVFYTMFTPIHLILVLLGKDPMRRKMEPESETYRVETKNHSREHMERPY